MKRGGQGETMLANEQMELVDVRAYSFTGFPLSVARTESRRPSGGRYRSKTVLERTLQSFLCLFERMT